MNNHYRASNTTAAATSQRRAAAKLLALERKQKARPLWKPANLPASAPQTTQRQPHSTVGALLAQRLACEFHDADDHHSPHNRAKMRAGTPLDDADRAPWLAALAALIASRFLCCFCLVVCHLDGVAQKQSARRCRTTAAPVTPPPPHTDRSSTTVLACSALKRAYRDILRRGAPDARFLHLQGDYPLLAARMAARTGHYMPLSLLASQLSTLEAPGPEENAQSFDLASRPEEIVAAVLAWRRTTGA